MTDAAIVSLLTELVVEMRGLRADIAGRQRGRLAPADAALLAETLPTVAAVVFEKVFAVADLAAHAELDIGADVRTVLATVGGPRKLGRLLRRADGFTVAGFRIDRVGEDRAGALWRVTTETRITRAGP